MIRTDFLSVVTGSIVEVRSYEEEDYGRAGHYRRSSGLWFCNEYRYGPAGTFQPNESVTVYYDDAIVADVQQIAEVSKTFTAKADGSLTLLYTFKASQAGKTIAVKAVGAVSGTKTATIQVPATGTGDQSGTTTATTANTGAAIAPYGVAVVLLAAAGIALFAVRKNTTRR